MSNNIGWCDCTINPVVGCSKCSPGCENCYAEKFAHHMSRNPQTGRKYAGVVDANGKWTGKVNVTLDAKTMPHRVPGKNKRVFVGSMSDLFHPNVSDTTRDVIFASILGDHIVGNGHGHTFMILTKRAEEMCNYFTLTPPDELLHRWGEAGDGWLTLEGDTSFSEYLESHLSYYKWKTFWPLLNLWVGATICNQEEADSKIPALLRTPAAKRFISVEPMLGPVNVERYLISCKDCGNQASTQLCLNRPWMGHDLCNACDKPNPEGPHLDWIICGGESGPGARQMHTDWVRSLRDQCVDAGVPFYFKGWGGTKKTPALLDGSEWREFPAQ